MSLKVVALSNLLSSYDESLPGDKKKVEQEVQELLNKFKSISVSGDKKQHDVEGFLQKRAIEFDKSGISKTHLVFAPYKGEQVLVGYYAISNKALVFTKRQLSRYSVSVQKRIRRRSSNSGEDVNNHSISAFLIGQLGKNHTDEALKTKAVNGKILLTLAYDTILDAQMLAGGSYIWLEYENKDKLRNLYNDFGFSEVEDYTSPTGLKMAFMSIS
ncbi:hypothetical protein ACFOU0_12095 [Salinicoccus sesuvii]|uniref:Phage protein n=1 Tax=Salinicoccus sesuvii TaxID=868281 RepID=A0ABV7N872_9STAP